MLDQGILREYLEKKDIWYKIHKKESTVHTADAAAKTGIPLERITKSLVCLTDSKAIVAIIPGNERLDTKKLARVIDAKKVRICPFKKVHEFSGYDPGATPPCCYENVERVIMDKKILEFETTFGGGGTNQSLLEIKPRDIVKLNKALVEDIT
ncbi:MAG: hypothetical protein GF368_02920 [Candidatus Aenigmarchaeota archaeon]|nr:hypothetical protein [Candidatus Aenigmarchaeota archaeon]